MSVQELRERIAHELATFTYAVPAAAIGRPLSPAAVQESLRQLRHALVEPYLVEVERRDTFEEVTSAAAARASVWVVAHGAPDTLVFYDPERDTFGLARRGARGLITFGVYGDLVDTFMAI